MPLQDIGTFRKDPKGNTGRLYVPADLVKDSGFPLYEGDIDIKIDGDSLIITMKNRLPKFEHFNVREDYNSVTIWDHEKNHLVDVNFHMKKPYVYCVFCEDHDCEHIRFALKLPEIIKTLEEQGFKIDGEEGRILKGPA